MERRYEVLFSIKVSHQKYDDKPVPGISLAPTYECQVKLARHNMLFKANDTGGLVVIEKLVDGNSPLTPTRPFNQLLDFTFLIENSNAALLDDTEPYASKTFQSELAGRFCFYFDNLKVTQLQDQVLELASNAASSSEADVFFLYPGKWSAPSTIAKQVQAQALKPGGKETTFVPDPAGASYIDVSLDPGAYQVERGTATGQVTERVLVQPGLRQTSFLGLVRIYKDQSTDYTHKKQYTITLQQKI